MSENKNGNVYFIKGEGTELVKIGTTNNPTYKRKEEIQNMSPVELTTIASLTVLNGSSGRAVEKELHEIFSSRRQWGEWFWFRPHEIALIKRSIKGSQGRKKKGIKSIDLESFKNYWNRELNERV